jgi:hypothetical protein
MTTIYTRFQTRLKITGCLRKTFYTFFAITFLIFGVSQSVFGQKQEDMRFVDAGTLMLIGSGFENSLVKYGRLPESINFRQELLDLGANSSGLAIRFSTNSMAIAAKWTVRNNFGMNHMAATGVKGLDLYIYDDGSNGWRYMGTAKPSSSKESFSVFANGIGNNDGVNGSGDNSVGGIGDSRSNPSGGRKMREYIAYLPLYDGVELLEIGVDKGADIGPPQKSVLTKSRGNKPIVFYGTSITQGGCASRPGMAYPAIVGRELGRETINLGFSGNGRMDISVAEAINRIDAAALVIDCLPNMTVRMVQDSAYSFIRHVADANSVMVIYMVENPRFPQSKYNNTIKAELDEENSVWWEVFEQLRRAGYANVEYISGENLVGEDGESTVDGTHFTDLGFMRYAQELLFYLQNFSAKIH